MSAFFPFPVASTYFGGGDSRCATGPIVDCLTAGCRRVQQKMSTPPRPSIAINPPTIPPIAAGGNPLADEVEDVVDVFVEADVVPPAVEAVSAAM